ncbi:hypothetical protein HK099_007449 [Clydaea vesicula]|uniref:non-specific serine/threonine protein kinase n=1 Tax=Clydaea vesicula TaxID=447962 RepID=A0AAD5XTN2_9FUNG|nr:hypothetical protein HK099_007449 [Clydaea vesicula]
MTYGNTLRKAHGLIRQYQVSHNKQNLERGVSLYEQVQRDLDKVLSKMTTLNLNEISPKLAMMKDLELSIPGTYSIHDEIVKIGSIHPVLTVMPSKQRPRRTEIIGSDGKTYQFLLKAHEDLRLDERVMQVFGLVNTLMKANPETLKRSLKITCYSVTPISTSSGLIGWVPNCDTLNNYICNYRDENKVRRDLEQLLIHSLAPKYDRLTLLQKVEIFEKVIELTSGEDLARSFWLKSKNSEVWLERRTNFTRSLALMSMVGYIIGLGDRHPLNLIVNKFSGSVVHIDFGDCFEVAMHRDKFPEKVPFRLTRMLVKAMEVGCLDGSFKITCESTMKVLREEKDSLMAVLEAFVYDPLINWRLMTGHSVDAGLSHTPSDESEKLSSTLSLDHHKSLGAGSIPLEDSEKKNFTDESLNQKALSVIDRIEKKLTGRDFKKGNAISVERQVELLIKEAISIENLCQSWHGWCPLWV